MANVINKAPGEKYFIRNVQMKRLTQKIAIATML